MTTPSAPQPTPDRLRPFRFALVCGAVLLAAYLSLIFLSHPWFLLTIEGRSFRSAILLDILGCIPFLWPFAVGSIWFARLAPRCHVALLWVIVLGITGGVLYSRLVTLLIPPSDSVFHYPRFYVRYALPLLVSTSAFIISRIFLHPRLASFLHQLAHRTPSTGTNERYEY